MSKAIGLALIVAGVGFGAYVLPAYLEPPASPAGSGPAKVATVQPPATQNTSAVVVREVARVEPRASAPAPKPQPAAKSPAPAPVAEPAPVKAAPFVATLPQRASEPTTSKVVIGQIQPSAAAVDRGALARELQKELKRVGCYGGEINGAWTPSTRQAMKSFTDRVNATLPIEQPDYILLAMVQNQAQKVCGGACPPGQAFADDGRCMPAAIIARKARAPAFAAAAPAPSPRIETVREKQAPPPVAPAWATTARATPPPPAMPVAPLEGRMTLSGPPVSRLERVPPKEHPRLAAAVPETQVAPPPPVVEQRAQRRRPARRAGTQRRDYDSRYASSSRRRSFAPAPLFRAFDRLGI